MMNPSIEVLEGARKTLERPESWTQKAYARAKDGLPVTIDSPEAVCWCLVGAIVKEEIIGGGSTNALNYVQEAADTHTIGQYNDDFLRKHEDILETLDKAIALAKEGAL